MGKYPSAADMHTVFEKLALLEQQVAELPEGSAQAVQTTLSDLSATLSAWSQPPKRRAGRRRKPEAAERADPTEGTVDDLLDTLYDFTSDGLLVVDADLSVQRVRFPAASNLPPDRAIPPETPLEVWSEWWSLFTAPDEQPVAVEEFPVVRAARRGEVTRNLELFLEDRQSPGQRYTILISASPLYASDGSRRGAVAFWKDITAERAAEQRLRRQQQQTHDVLASITDCYYRLDRHWRITEINDAALKFFEKPRDFFLGQSIWRLYPAGVDTLFQAEYLRPLSDGRPVHFESPTRLTDRWAEVFAYPDENGLSVYFRDISVRKLTEQALRETNQKLRSMLNSITEAYFLLDRNWRILDCNRVAEHEFLCKPAEELLGKVYWDLYPESIGGEFYRQYHRAFATGYPVHFEALAERVQQWYEVHVYPRGDQIEVYLHNIDRRKRNEERLAYQAHLLENVHDAIIATDENLAITAFNRAAEALYGWTADEALGGDLFEVLQIDPRSPEMREAFRQMRLVGRATGTFVHHHRSGRAIQVESNGIALHDAHGQITGYAMVNRDVTEQKRVQRELIQSRQRMTEILESINDGFFTLGRDWRFIYANHRAAWQFGFEPEDLIGQPIWTAVPQLADSPVEALCRRVSESGEPDSTVAYNSFCDCWFEMRAYPTADGGIAVYTIDKTEARQHELERERLLAENQRQKHLLERLLAETPAGIAFTSGPDHRYVLVNPAYRYLARGKGELLGRTVAEVWAEEAGEMLPLLDRVYQGEMIHAQEMPFDVVRSGQKETIYITFTYTPLQNDDGSIEGTLILASEVTDQVQARRMVEAERARLQAVFQHAPEGLIVTDAQARILLTNPVAEQLLGRPIPVGQEFDRPADLNICHPDGTPFAPHEMPLARAALDGENVSNLELLVRWPNGKTLNLLLNAGPVLGQDGIITGAVAVLQDITERKQMEEALRASEAKVRRLIDSNLIGILYGNHGQITEANDAFLNMLGYSRDELASGQLYWRALTPPEYFELDEQRSEEAFARGVCTPYEKEFIHKDGHRVPVLIGYALLSSAKHDYVAFILDLTERKQAESNARFLADLGQRMISVFDWDKRMKIAVTSLGRYLRVTRCLMTELDPETDRLTIHIDYAKGLPSCAGEHRLSMWPKGLVEEFQRGRLVAVEDLAADERTRAWYESFYQPMGMRAGIFAPRMHGGQWVATLVITTSEPRAWHNDEISLVRSAADLIWLSLRNARLGADLAESQRRLDLALKNSSLVVYTLDRDLNCTWVYNPQKDFQPSEVIGKPVEHILPLDDAEQLVALQRAVLETGESTHGEVHGHDREGKLRFFDVTLEPLRSEGGVISGLAVSVMDISSMRRLEQEIIESATQLEIQRQILRHRELERVEIARELHDGPLQDLIALSFSLTDALEIADKSDRLAKLDVLQETIQRQIRELRSFCSELRPPTLAPFGLERAILSHADTFRSKYPHIHLDLDLMHDGQSLDEDLRLTLYRIYQELMTNVVRHAEATAVTVRLWLDENEVTLVVEDNGRGFTLADNWLNLVRQGHLGLVGVRERVESLGGTVKVFSAPGEGATVMVVAPRGVRPE